MKHKCSLNARIHIEIHDYCLDNYEHVRLNVAGSFSRAHHTMFTRKQPPKTSLFHETKCLRVLKIPAAVLAK